eukprot:6407420-Prymnesium_polylepis.1
MRRRDAARWLARVRFARRARRQGGRRSAARPRAVPPSGWIWAAKCMRDTSYMRLRAARAG